MADQPNITLKLDDTASEYEMRRFVEREDRRQAVLLPEYPDDYISEENPVRVIDVFVSELDLRALGFAGGDRKAGVSPWFCC